MKFFKFIFLGILWFHNLNGQVNPLSFYADVMANANLVQHRIYAEEQFSNLLKDKIKKDEDGFRFLDEVKGISNINLQANNARIVTWQYKMSENSYRHFGIIIDKDKRIINLEDQSQVNGDRHYEVLNTNEWHGAYYYDHLYDSTGQYYILFGFNGVNEGTLEKIADVLYMDANGTWKFGKEIFFQKEDNNRPDIKTRISIQYSPSSVATMRFDKETNMIIHDFTVASANDFDGKFIGKVPDGTYVAYEKKDNYWKLIEKLENTPLRDMNPDYNKKRDPERPDILGRSPSNSAPRKKRN